MIKKKQCQQIPLLQLSLQNVSLRNRWKQCHSLRLNHQTDGRTQSWQTVQQCRKITEYGNRKGLVSYIPSSLPHILCLWYKHVFYLLKLVSFRTCKKVHCWIDCYWIELDIDNEMFSDCVHWQRPAIYLRWNKKTVTGDQWITEVNLKSEAYFFVWSSRIAEGWFKGLVSVLLVP